MFMKNNKGQTLVVFVIILPLIVLLLTMIINEGSLYIQKRTMENTIKEAILYRFDFEGSDEEVLQKIERYLYKNIDNIEYLNIDIDDGYIKINIESSIEKELPSFIFQNQLTIKFTYIGYINNEKIIIEKE
ncbi:MAG: hypothetical protein GX190_01995 [Mollicutes bacterium]|nr:hypothetical protein [Mollicutes bacterium]